MHTADYLVDFSHLHSAEIWTPAERQKENAMSKVKKTVLQVAKQIAKNQGSTIVEAVNEMMIVLETDLHNNRMLIVDTDDGSYELASENLIETIQSSSKNEDMDSALFPVMESLGFIDGGTMDYFVADNFHAPSWTRSVSQLPEEELGLSYAEIWKRYTVKQRATILCKFVSTFVEAAIED